MDCLASLPFSVGIMMQECSIEQDSFVEVLRIGVMIATQMLTSLTCSPGGMMTGACCSDLCVCVVDVSGYRCSVPVSSASRLDIP